MFVLGIETSCDETGLCIMECDGEGSVKVLSEIVASQIDLHAKYGGVVPELASREHMESLPVLLDQAITQSGVELSKIDRVAVTGGPGLKGCLLTGLVFAKGLVAATRPPMGAVIVNHIEAHILSPFITRGLKFPFLSLVVSGGHTELINVSAVGRYEVISRTIDDAAGEAFDKSAHLLGIPYPGGAKLASIADTKTSSRFTLPKVMREAKGFSFSGLKTAVSLLVSREMKRRDEDTEAELAFAIQDSIVDAIVFKTKKALAQTGIRTLSLVGGVAANRALRDALSALSGIELLIPERRYCGDNGTMIAYAGSLKREADIGRFLSAGPIPRWPVEEICEG